MPLVSKQTNSSIPVTSEVCDLKPSVGNESKVRIGVIGLALRGQHSYEQILRHDSRVNIVAASHYAGASDVLAEGRADASFNEAYALDLGAEYYENHLELLSRDDIDCICLMCEPSRALELAKQCLDSGKHVLRDKPLTKYAEESIELAEHANHEGLMLLLAMPLRFHPILSDVKNSVQSDQIGDVTAVTMGYVWTNGPLAGFTASQDYADAYGGGDVLTAGYHAVDYLNWLIESEPVSVYAKIGSFFYPDYKKLNLDDLGHVSIRYANGVFANLLAGRCTAKRPPINWLDISGTSGAIDVRDFRSNMTISSDSCQKEVFDSDPLSKLGKRIVDALESNDPTGLDDGYDGAKASAVLEAAQKSMRTGMEVTI